MDPYRKIKSALNQLPFEKEEIQSFIHKFQELTLDDETVILCGGAGDIKDVIPHPSKAIKFMDKFKKIIAQEQMGQELPLIEVIRDEEEEKEGGGAKLKLHKENLESTFGKAENRNIAIFGVGGEFGQNGKSFIATNSLKMAKRQCLGWYVDSSPIGFSPWPGKKEDFRGITIWSNPFQFVNEKKETFDLFIIDLQGASLLSEEERKMLLKITLLLSSSFVFVGDNSEKAINSFKDCLEFQKEITEIGPKRIVYLAQNSQNKTTGYMDKSFLLEKLSLKEMSSNCSLEMFLMPEETIEKLDPLNYQFLNLSTSFTNKLINLIEKEINGKVLPLKMLGDTQMKSEFFANLISKFIFYFNINTDSNLGLKEEAETLLDLSAVLLNEKTIAKIGQVFEKDFMEMIKKYNNENETDFATGDNLNKYYGIISTELISRFEKNCFKFKTPRNMELAVTEIKMKFNDIFEKIKLKNEEMKADYLSKIEGDLKTGFQNEILIFEETNGAITETAANLLIQRKVEELQQKSGIIINGDEDEKLMNFKTGLEVEINRILEENKKKKEDLKNEFLEEAGKRLNWIDNEIKSKVQDFAYVPIKALQDIFDQASDGVVDELVSILENSDISLNKEIWLTGFSTNLEAILIKFMDENEDKYKVFVRDFLKEKIDVLISTYEEELKEKTKFLLPLTSLENEDLRQFHANCKEKALNELKKNEQIKTLHKEAIEDLMKTLDGRLDQVFIRNKENIKEKQQLIQMTFKIAFDSNIDKLNNSRTPATEEELNNRKENAFRETKIQMVRDGKMSSEEDPIPQELLDEIEFKFTAILNANKELKERLEREVKNVMNEEKSNYERAMTAKIIGLYEEKKLNAFHAAEKNRAMTSFRRKCEQFVIPTNEYAEKLSELIEEEFGEDSTIRKSFLTSKADHEKIINTTTTEARGIYFHEMDNLFKEKAFHEIGDLNSFHRRIVRQTMEKVKDENMLTESQEKETQKALEIAFKKYQNLNHENTPKNPTIGIDLGTTYSCVGVLLNGKVEILKNEMGNKTTPSFYGIYNGSELTGDAAKAQSAINPENTIYDSKRFIGKRFDNEEVQGDILQSSFQVIRGDNDMNLIVMKGRNGEDLECPPEEISAKILKKMKLIADKYLGQPVTEAVITVPAYFNEPQRNATKLAGEIAGLKVLKILNEPTAAAIAYHLQHQEQMNRRVVIYDLGGGTFDISVLRIVEGEINVETYGGDTHLGGEDFDNRMVNKCIDYYLETTGKDLRAGESSNDKKLRTEFKKRMRRLKNICELTKQHLSVNTSDNITLGSIYEGKDFVMDFTREVFEEINQDLFQKTIDLLTKTLRDANIDVKSVDDIVLVGGSTRIPKIIEMVKEFFGGKEPNKRIDPDEAVGYGAAILAALESGKIVERLKILKDVTPHSIGIELSDNTMSVIIPKNTKVPVSVTKSNFNTKWGWAEIPIYEGEDTRTAENNNLMGSFVLDNIPTNSGNVDVIMEITDENILKVKAVAKSTGHSGQIAITENRGNLSNHRLTEIKQRNL